tara:strand:- start:2154 stop:2864 length:711 start_codon:yes stop_codon:yes gene_type:complete
LKIKNKYSYSGKDELLNSGNNLKNYYSKIVKIILKDFKFKGKEILDFGAGIGTLSVLYENFSGIKPFCVELDNNNFKFLRSNGFKVFKSLSNSKKKFDAVFSSNVLEHIEDDQKTIHEIYNKLNKNGLLFLFLPAFQILYSDMDKKVGHFRRYKMSEIKEKVEKANFKVSYCYYVDSLGFFASLLMKLLGYSHRKGIGSPGSLKFYDKYIVPLSFFLDGIGLKKVFGKNLILLAKK